MRRRNCLLVAALLLVGTASAGPAVERELSASFLVGKAKLLRPVAMREFTAIGTAAGPRHTFSGLLRLQVAVQMGGFDALHDPFDLVGKIGRPVRHLPEFDFQFVQRNDDIVPLQHGVIRRQHPYWEIVVQPGRAWSEPDDGEWTRASVPFALQERSANCTHNGVLTWLFNDKGAISRVVYQISSETCAYFKFDMWGVAIAEYRQQNLQEKAAAAIERLDVHRQNRLPVRPLAQLGVDYPGVDSASLGIDDGIDAEDISVMGLVVDGINYRSACNTRQGPYPYCDAMPLPSYSTAKSIFAGIATMRLEKLFPGVSQSSIAALIDVCAPSKWQDVTIENALDMATGNYLSANFDEDEDSAAHVGFLDSDSHKDKLEFACNHFERKADPGLRFVYHTSDTYLAGAALGNFLAQRDEGADLYYSVLVRPIWHQLQLSPLLDASKRTYDRTNHAYVGYGLTYEVDDIARIATWLSMGGGQLNGIQMLDEKMLDAALQRDADDRGLEAGSSELLYNNGFWAFNAGPSMACEAPVWVPFMSGYGGITVAMFPNGVIYYYFSDSYVFKWQSARIAANTIGNMCHGEANGVALMR